MATGRRAGASTTKSDILNAARDLFAEVGYERATIRAIASRAGVDVALVPYYFGNKLGVFREAMNLPFNPAEVFGGALDGPRSGIGERLLRALLGVWEDPQLSTTVKAVMRGALSADADVPNPFAEFIAAEVIPILTNKAEVSIETGRVVASALFGMAFLRYLMRSPIYTELTVDELVANYAPAIQLLIEAD